MKYLLVAINAKYIHSNPAIYSLKAYAGAELAEDIELAEYTINQYPRDILGDIVVRQPDVIGFSCYIWNITLIDALLQDLHKLLPETDIWLGGPEVSYDPEAEVEKYPHVKGVFVGEGENSFKQMVLAYRKALSEGVISNANLRDIPGLYIREQGYTSPTEPVDMDELPFLYEDTAPFENRIIYYESSRGCPYRCSYCLSSVDKTVRLRSLKVVEKELQFLLDRQVKQVKFIDRTFNCNHDHAMGIWRYIKEHDNGVTNFHFEISADIFREEEIELLNSLRPGLVQLEIGVQSANPKTLKAINRFVDMDRLATHVSGVRKGHNMHVHLDLIAGLPHEDYDSFHHSFNIVYAMEPDELQLGFLKVLKGSPMEKCVEEFGIVFSSLPPYEVLYTRWLSYKDVLKLKSVEEMVEIYYNSAQFVHSIRYLVELEGDPFRLYERLAEFYENRGYKLNTPARSHRYRVLLEFGQSLAEQGEKISCTLLRDLLTHDCYLRENLKSRYDFMTELSDETKSIVKSYFAHNDKTRQTHVEVYTREFAEYMGLDGAALVYEYDAKDPLTGNARWVQYD